MTVEDQPTPAGSSQQRIEQQLATLEDIQQRPLTEHAERYGSVHAQLQVALTEIDGGSS
jgi:hypothetical protein